MKKKKQSRLALISFKISKQRDYVKQLQLLHINKSTVVQFTEHGACLTYVIKHFVALE